MYNTWGVYILVIKLVLKNMQYYSKYLHKVFILCTVYVFLFLVSLTEISPETEMQFLDRLAMYKYI